MNSPSLPSRGQPHAAAQPEFRRQVEEWRQLLSQCGRKPTRKSVHGLRVATLRVQAVVECWLRGQEPDAPATRAAECWIKQGKKLRRVLNPVREADVSLAKLARLRASTAEPPEGQPPCGRSCLRQIGELERRLAERRQAAAKELVAGIEDRRKRLERLSSELEAALAPHPCSCSAEELRTRVAGLREKFPELDAKSLHPFRKRIKKVRYLAEISAATDPLAGQQAVTLRRMQSAAGEWHDWQGLAQMASRAFRRGDTANGLAKLLEAQAQESLKEALKLCRRATGTLLNRRGKSESSEPLAKLHGDSGKCQGTTSVVPKSDQNNSGL